MMVKILLSFVGNQDPVSDNTMEEGSVVTLCRHLQPDIVYLLPTAEGHNIRSSTQANAELTREWINKEVDQNIKVYIKPINLKDPRDYGVILPVVRRTVGQIYTELSGETVETHMNCSSGTPQLKSTWLILANSGLFHDSFFWQVANPQFAGDNRVEELQTTFLEEENTLNRLRRYATEFLFKQTAEEAWRLKQISVYSHRRQKAALLHKIFLSYHQWDLIQYKAAHKGLVDVMGEIGRTRDLASLSVLIEKQVKLLESLKQNSAEENSENIADLCCNAQRCLTRNNYTDTLARFWRVYEGSLYKHLRKKYGLSPNNLVQSRDKSQYQKVLDYARRNPKELSPTASRLGIKTAGIVLREVFRDPTLAQLENATVLAKRNGRDERISAGLLMDTLRGRRNDSIVAHGMEPVLEEDAINAMALMTEIYGTFFNIQYLREYPFQGREIEQVVDTLTAEFYF